MSKGCYIIAHQILSSLGDSAETINSIRNQVSGIREITDISLSEKPFYGAIFSDTLREKLKAKSTKHTILENGLIYCIESVLNEFPEFKAKRGVLILTSTKGNIDLLNQTKVGEIPAERANMAEMAKAINNYFNFSDTPIFISNACISGVSALLMGQKIIATKAYDYAVVAGGDLISKFVVSGFQSLMAVSNTPCKPYDKSRTGMTPGEGCAAVLLAQELPDNRSASIRIVGGSQSNDANHISGPSRSGEGLINAVLKAFAEANCSAQDIDMVNAHGTATVFNDEMESIAFNRLGLAGKPINSLKGYFGHTFGAAGLIETIITAESLKTGLAFKTLGLDEPGVSETLNLTTKHTEIKLPKRALKTISGFGGTNAALILEKVES